ncbi:MAG TPA: tail fiber domain-containing protein [Candidatus Binataceae bacterium]|nr:tail fiber domain-containing protein [Candidatus Binataceae bacterium]
MQQWLPERPASNTASGVEALFSNTTGTENTATGAGALGTNTIGNFNTASGADALGMNTTDESNTAGGVEALFSNSTGAHNTATGAEALFSNTIGHFNTAAGGTALALNTTGAFNTAAGASALALNTTGNQNTGVGQAALYNNTSGQFNTGAGLNALLSNSVGNSNTAVGHGALRNSTTGSNNIGLGVNAGFNSSIGSNNIDIGNTGVAAESRTIRIGTQGAHTRTFMGGIFGSMVTGDAVMVSNTGQLGIVVSSARYKRDIHDMGNFSEALMKLRPVAFRYKDDPSQQRQYGLVAEEVARAYPDLVSRDAAGEVVSVHYHELVPMLLNEVQKQAQQIKSLNAKIAQDQAQRASFEQRLLALERTFTVRDRNQTLAAALER